jgi:type IV secretory pathway VirB3-like protein
MKRCMVTVTFMILGVFLCIAGQVYYEIVGQGVHCVQVVNNTNEYEFYKICYSIENLYYIYHLCQIL